MIEQIYPSGRVVKNVIDGNGDLEIVQSKKDSAAGFWNYAQNFSYNSAGAVTSMQFGNGKWESTQFNSRLQPTQIALGATPNATNLLKLDYEYGASGSVNNGNITKQTITVPTVGVNTGFTAVQDYTYDSLNRLKSAVENVTPHGGSATQSWKQTYTFDRFGNRRFDFTSGNTTFPDPNCPEAICNPTISTTNNRLTSTGWSYDSAGNTTNDPEGRTFIYDAENKQTEVRDQYNTVIGQYFFDGDGKRVKKIVPATSEVTIFVYDASGRSIAEYSTVVESVENAKVAYLTADHLGSPRINTDRDGNVTSRHDYHPFGEEILTTQRTTGLVYDADTIRRKFTTYERDVETDLDFAQARMYSKSLGRFTSVDPLMASADIANPQTTNRYVYVGNNPINIVDPTGLIWGQLNGNVEWFGTEAAMTAAGYSAYTLLFAYRTGTNQLVALNSTTGMAVNVASAAAWLSQQVAWGGTAATLSASAAVLAGVPIAAAALILGEVLDPAGAHRHGLSLPEPVREFRGTQPSYWEDFLTQMAKIKAKEANAGISVESSPADPNSVKPDGDDEKPSVPDASGLTRLSRGEIRALKKAGIDPHDLKPKIGGSKFDLFKDRKGEIYVNAKNGQGTPEPTFINIKDLKLN